MATVVPLPKENMIQPQSWPALRQEVCRTLPLPRLNVSRDSLSDLADAASNMGQSFSTTRSLSPDSSSEHASSKCPCTRLSPTTESNAQPYLIGQYALSTTASKHCSLPGFSELFSDVITAADRRPDYRDGFVVPNFARRGSADSDESRRGSLSSVPGLSPLSTAHTSPIISPTTPPASFSIPNQNQLQICLRLTDYRDDQERQKRKLTQIRSRRTPSRHSLYGDLDAQHFRGTHSPSHSIHLHHHHHQQQRKRSPVTTTALPLPPPSNLPVSSSSTTENANEREPHFNQKYKDPDKLFIVYHKEDQRWSWPAILTRRLQLLPVLLGPEYNRQVEEHRRVSGLNGMYYRENENMSVLTPDGSGLVFAEKDGRWWEVARSQKCRTGGPENSSNNGGGRGRRGSGAGTTSASASTSAAAITAADTRPRGMVERYPEEVVHYWDRHVRHFIPEERQAEILARARRYSKSSPLIQLPHLNTVYLLLLI